MMSWERDEADRLDRAAGTLSREADESELAMRRLRDRVADVHGRRTGWMGGAADRHLAAMDDQAARIASAREALRRAADSMQRRARELRQQAADKEAAARAAAARAAAKK